MWGTGTNPRRGRRLAKVWNWLKFSGGRQVASAEHTSGGGGGTNTQDLNCDVKKDSYTGGQSVTVYYLNFSRKRK